MQDAQSQQIRRLEAELADRPESSQFAAFQRKYVDVVLRLRAQAP
jgi:hypothetical protein